MNIYTIYKATNKVNNKVYIGFTQDYEERVKTHKRDSQKYNKDIKYKIFYSAIQKHSWDNFDWEIIYQSKELNHTKNEMEKYFIEEYNAFVGTENYNGYNMTLGGEGSNGRECRKATKAKISNALSEHYKQEENRGRQSIVTKKAMENLSPEKREKMKNASLGKITARDVSTGKIIGKIDKDDIRVISGEYSHNLVGFQHSEMTKLKMSISKKGKNPYERTEETNKNISKGRVGKGLGEKNSMAKQENRNKVAQSKIGRKKYINIETNSRKYCYPGTEPDGFVLVTSIKK